MYTKWLSGNDFENNACLLEIGALFFNLENKYRNFYNKAFQFSLLGHMISAAVQMVAVVVHTLAVVHSQ